MDSASYNVVTNLKPIGVEVREDGWSIFARGEVDGVVVEGVVLNSGLGSEVRIDVPVHQLATLLRDRPA